MCIPIHVYGRFIMIFSITTIVFRGLELLREDTFSYFDRAVRTRTRTVTFGRVTVPPKTVLTGTATLSGWSNTLKT